MPSKRTLILLSLILTPVFSSAMAQNDPKIEVTPFIGYTFSEGVPVNQTDIGDGQIVDRLNPTSGFSYGFEFDFLLGDNAFVGFNFAEQSSNLEARIQGSGKRTFTDMQVRNYHGIIGYNFGDYDSTVRPYFFGGLGATNFSPNDIQGQSVDGSTRFSSTWGGGVKFFANDNFGFRGGVRWTPTHINTSADGLWCSPWYPWGCWVVGNANYANQFEMSGGVVIRF